MVWTENIIIPENVNVEFNLDEIDDRYYKREKIIDIFNIISKNPNKSKYTRFRLIKTLDNKVMLIGNNKSFTYRYILYEIDRLSNWESPIIWRIGRDYDNLSLWLSTNFDNKELNRICNEKFKSNISGLYLFTDF
jgi:hypothetical protein